MNESDGKLPLGIMRQACLKLDSFITDICECIEDPDLSDDDREAFNNVKETASTMQAEILSIVQNEMDEETFLNEQPEMDPLPGEQEDMLDEEV